MFRILTGLKFETLFLSFDFLSTGKTEATFASSEKTPLEILLFAASTWIRNQLQHPIL